MNMNFLLGVMLLFVVGLPLVVSDIDPILVGPVDLSLTSSSLGGSTHHQRQTHNKE